MTLPFIFEKNRLLLIQAPLMSLLKTKRVSDVKKYSAWYIRRVFTTTWLTTLLVNVSHPRGYLQPIRMPLCVSMKYQCGLKYSIIRKAFYFGTTFWICLFSIHALHLRTQLGLPTILKFVEVVWQIIRLVPWLFFFY